MSKQSEYILNCAGDIVTLDEDGDELATVRCNNYIASHLPWGVCPKCGVQWEVRK